jgi:hypothetical protein
MLYTSSILSASTRLLPVSFTAENIRMEFVRIGESTEFPIPARMREWPCAISTEIAIEAYR